MSRGYITIAQNSGDLDYVRMAYALAARLRKPNEVDEFAIIVDPNYESMKNTNGRLIILFAMGRHGRRQGLEN